MFCETPLPLEFKLLSDRFLVLLTVLDKNKIK